MVFCFSPFRSLQSPGHAIKRAGLKAGKPAAFTRGDRLHRHHKATRAAHVCDSIGSTAARAAGGFVCIGRSTARAVVDATSLCIATTTARAIGLHTSSHRWVNLPLPLVVAPAHANGCNTQNRRDFPKRPNFTTRRRAPGPLVQQPPHPTRQRCRADLRGRYALHPPRGRLGASATQSSPRTWARHWGY